jgi:thioredoxin reductase
MVEVRHRESVEIKEANFLLGALGRIPDADFLSEEICQKEDELAARKILYFIGDVRNGIYRQTAIAAGDALRAAMEIEEFYKEKL